MEPVAILAIIFLLVAVAAFFYVKSQREAAELAIPVPVLPRVNEVETVPEPSYLSASTESEPIGGKPKKKKSKREKSGKSGRSGKSGKSGRSKKSQKKSKSDKSKSDREKKKSSDRKSRGKVEAQG